MQLTEVATCLKKLMTMTSNDLEAHIISQTIQIIARKLMDIHVINNLK